MTEYIELDNGRDRRLLVSRSTTRPNDLPRLHRGARGRAGPPPPCHLRHRPARGHPAGGRTSSCRTGCISRPGRTSTPSRARSFSMSGGAGGKPGRARQCRCAAHPRARLAAGEVDGGRPPEGPGMGVEDHRDLSHTRHAPGGGDGLGGPVPSLPPLCSGAMLGRAGPGRAAPVGAESGAGAMRWRWLRRRKPSRGGRRGAAGQGRGI